MELFSSICILVGISLFVYNIMKRYEAQRVGATKIEEEMLVQKEKSEEQERKNIIIDKVDNFLAGSQFIEPVAKWREEDIFQYIFNNGYLYEFEETLSENNQKVGIDDELLCFKRLCYKRVKDPTDFVTKYNPVV